MGFLHKLFAGAPEPVVEEQKPLALHLVERWLHNIGWQDKIVLSSIRYAVADKAGTSQEISLTSPLCTIVFHAPGHLNCDPPSAYIHGELDPEAMAKVKEKIFLLVQTVDDRFAQILSNQGYERSHDMFWVYLGQGQVPFGFSNPTVLNVGVKDQTIHWAD